MQTQLEDEEEKGSHFHKSLLRYTPYVVAFATKESYHDQKIDCGKQELSPNSSLPLNANDNSFETTQNTISESDTTILQETKINIDQDDLDYILSPTHKDCGFKRIENIATDKVNMDGLYKQPQVLFSGSKCKKCKPQRKVRCHKRSNHSTNQITNKIEKNIQRFYSDKNSTVAENRKDLYEDCTTEVVSRCRVVKNALAKENLLGAMDQDTENEMYHCPMDIDSLTSSSTEKTLKVSLSSKNDSFASQKTLKSKSIDSCNNDVHPNIELENNPPRNGTLDTTNLNDINHKHSKNGNSSDNFKNNDDVSVSLTSDSLFPYQPNVINVGLAVTETSKVQKVRTEIKENFQNNAMTRGVTFDNPSAEFTSRDPSSDLFHSSIDTLVDTTSSMKKGSNVTLTLLRKKSLSNRSSCSYALSASLLKHNEDPFLYTFLTSATLPNRVKTFSCKKEKSSPKQWTTESKVLSSQSTHKKKKSSNKTSGDSNDIKNTSEEINSTKKPEKGANDGYVSKTKQPKLVVDKMRNKCNPRSKGFFPKQKTSLNGNVKHYQNSHFPSTPHEGTLKAMIEKIKLIDDLADVPLQNRAEIWEKVSLVLDIIAHRLEHSLTDRIIKEIRKLSSSQDANCDQADLGKPSNYKQNIKTDSSSYSHKSFQCTIVDNKMLDDMMLKLSMDGPKVLVQPKAKSIFIDEPVLFKNIEILKSPVAKNRNKEAITVEDSSLTTTSTLAVQARKSQMLVHQRLKYAVMVSFKFVKENILVIAAVPTFFGFIFIVYTIVAILSKFL